MTTIDRRVYVVTGPEWDPSSGDPKPATTTTVLDLDLDLDLVGDGKVVLDLSGDTVTVAGRLEQFGVGGNSDWQGPVYRIVEPS